MFFVDHIDNKTGKIAIANNTDLSIELVSKEDFNKARKLGVELYIWDEVKLKITSAMNNRCNNKLFKELLKSSNTYDLLSYLRTHTVYTIAQLLNINNLSIDFDSKCGVYPYNEVFDFITFVVKLSDGSNLICKSMSNNCIVQRLTIPCHFDKYPSISGKFLLTLANRCGVSLNSIDLDGLYLLFYSDSGDELIVVNQFNLGNPNNILKFSVNRGQILM